MIDRRNTFISEEAKFLTQKELTYAVVFIFFLAAGWTFYRGSDAQQATVLQTIINLVIAGFSYWIGSSKGAADNRDQLNKMLPQSPPPQVAQPISVDDVHVDANTATVTTKEPV